MAEVKRDYLNLTQLMKDSGKYLKEEQLEALLDELEIAYKGEKNVYLAGAGRSGLVARAFAMRLAHLGIKSCFVQDTVTPKSSEGDLMICISGSGKTKSTLGYAERGKEVGLRVIAITSYPNSPLGRLADLVVEVPGRETIENNNTDYEARQLLGKHAPFTPMGTLFESNASCLCDSVISVLAKKFKVREEEMRKRHTDIE